MLFNRKATLLAAEAIPAPAPGPLPEAIARGNAAFDYIVVGAGAAGCALVNRIVAGLPGATVLLLEAGPPNDVPEIRNFTEAMALRGTAYDWNDSSQQQRCLDGQQVAYDSGHANGGGTSINGMVWVRGNPGDYERWALSGCTGWAYGSVLPVFERQESYTGTAVGPGRGTSGPIQVTNRLSINVVSENFAESMMKMGYPFNEDYNSGTQQGVAFTQLNVAPTAAPVYGIRQDSYNAFVAPLSADPRLTAVAGAQVQRVAFDAQGKVTGVWFAYGGNSYFAAASTEVIVCAGTLRTPQILMLSGIGDPNVLRSFGIDVVHTQPAVGQNLQDQLIPFVVWNLKTTDPQHFTVMDNNVFAGDGGPGGAPDYEMQTFYMKNNPGFPPNCFALGAIVLHPQTRGQVTLASGGFTDPPLIQPSLMCGLADVSASVAGLKLARMMARQFAADWSWLGEELDPGPSVVTEQQLIEYIKRTAVPDFHYVGTSKMGTGGDCVVDPLCRVNGVSGLRVADASIMPFVTSGNTNAPANMIGGRCGDFIVAGTS